MSSREAKLLHLCPAYTKFMDSLVLMYCEIEDPTLLVNNSVPLEPWFRRNILGECRKRGSERIYKHVAKNALDGNELLYSEFQTLLVDLYQAWACEYIEGSDQQVWEECLLEVERYLNILRPGLWSTIKASGLLESLKDYFQRIGYHGQCENRCGHQSVHSSNRYRSLEEYKKDAKYTTHSDYEDDIQNGAVSNGSFRPSCPQCMGERNLINVHDEESNNEMDAQDSAVDERSDLDSEVKAPDTESCCMDNGVSPIRSSPARSRGEEEEINRIKQRFGIPVRDESVDIMD